MKRFRFRTAFKFYICTRSRENEHRRKLINSFRKYPNEKTILKISDDIPTKTVELNIESTGSVQEEPVFFDTTDQQKITEKVHWKRKEAAQNAIPNDPPAITVSQFYANDLNKDKTFLIIAKIRKQSRILIEQDSVPTLLNFERKMLALPFDEKFSLTDAPSKQYSRNKKRIIIKDDILCRRNHNDLGEVSQIQVFLPGQVLKVLLQSLHGTAGKHPSNSIMMQKFRQKFYFPSTAT